MASSCSESEGSATTLGTSGGKDGDGGSGRTAASGLKKGPWTAGEDAILMEYVKKHGEGNWNAVQRNSGLLRCGKSCRLRWANHLRPNLKKGSFSPEEERLILELHAKLGNKWARMAAQMPGRTDNEIKNYWNTRMKRRQRAGLPIYPPDIQRQAAAAAAAAAAEANNSSAVHQLRPPAPPHDASKSHQFRRHASTPLSSSPFTPVVNFQKFGNHNLFSSSMPCSSTPAQFFQTRMPDKRFREERGGVPDMSSTMLFYTNPVQSSMLGYQSHSPLHLHQQQHHQHFSLKMDLPSSQMFPPLTQPDDGTAERWEHGNGGLLDALLGDAHHQAITTGDVGAHPLPQFTTNRQAENGLLQEPTTANDAAAATNWGDADTDSAAPGGGTTGHGQTSEAINTWGATESDIKASEMGREMHAGEDDLSALLEDVPQEPMMTPVPTKFSDWCDGEIQETSASGRPDFLVNVDGEVGLEMHQSTSSLSTEGDDHTWNSNSTSHWSNMSGIC